MSHSESNNNLQDQWFFIRWFLALGVTLQKGIAWLFPSKMDYPDNEAGELMRRSMEAKSWFDSLSSTWVEQYFWLQSVVVVGAILGMGLIGWFVGAPVIFALAASFTCIVTHVLLVSHVHHRLNSAQLLSKEALFLNEDLEVSKELFAEATCKVEVVVEELHTQSNGMIQQAKVLDEHTRGIEQQNDALMVRVEEVQASTNSLLAVQKETYQELEQVAEHLSTLDNAIKDSTTLVEAVVEGVSTFTSTVREIQSSQNVYSEAVTRFSLFAEEQMAKKIPDINLSSEESYAALKAELDENEVLIAEMKRAMGAS